MNQQQPFGEMVFVTNVIIGTDSNSSNRAAPCKWRRFPFIHVYLCSDRPKTRRVLQKPSSFGPLNGGRPAYGHVHGRPSTIPTQNNRQAASICVLNFLRLACRHRHRSHTCGVSGEIFANSGRILHPPPRLRCTLACRSFIHWLVYLGNCRSGRSDFLVGCPN